MEMVEAYWGAQIVGVAARLGLADILADGPRTGSEVARCLGAMPDSTTRLLRSCAALGLLREVERDRFALTPVGACLGSGGPSLRDFAVALTDRAHWRSWERLAEAVMTGQPATGRALGMDLWEYYRQHPEPGLRFARAMAQLSARAAARIASRHDLSRCRRIVDVGGGQGVMLAELLVRAPWARGVLHDVPAVMPDARILLTRRGVVERVELAPGDMLQAVPEGGDLYVLKSVLHNWDDERAARILRNCHRAARPGSALLLIGTVLPPPPQPSAGRLLDLLMLVMTGGRERTREEYAALLGDAGYVLERTVRVLDEVDLIEGRRG
jgi:SAM-dependent methyltransferase